MPKHRILTLEQLAEFCRSKGISRFDANETGSLICVQIPAEFEQIDTNSESMLYAVVKMMHTGRNRNGSNLTLEAAKKCLNGIKYKPILANFIEYEEDGKMVTDFTSHDMEINEDGDCVYIEHQVGCFTVQKPYIEHDDESDRDYVYAYAAIPREYTPTAEIIERKNGTKVSVELGVSQMSYDAKNRELMLEEVEVLGCTLLGKRENEDGEIVDVNEGMEGARLDIKDFNFDPEVNMNPELLDILHNEEIIIDKNHGKEENTLMKDKVVITEDESLDTTENTVEESQLMDTDEVDTPEVVCEDEPDNVDESDNADEPIETSEEVEQTEESATEESDGAEEEFSGEQTNNISYSVNGHNFEVSLNDIQRALFELVNDTYSEQDNALYSVIVYAESKTIVMVDYWTDTAYRQSYKVRKNEYSLVGDRVRVHSIWMTDDEESEWDKMKSNYSSAMDKLQKHEEEPLKMEILNSADYEKIADAEEFISLKDIKNHFDLSIGEVREKADAIILAYAKGGKIDFSENVKKGISCKKIIDVNKGTKKGRYGSLFSKKENE